MKKIKAWIRRMLFRLTYWALEDTIMQERWAANRRIDSAEDSMKREVRTLRDQMTALQALDVGFQESGKLILIARIGGHDMVKITDVSREWTIPDYKRFSDRIEAEYGARARFVDAGRAGEAFWRQM